MFHLTKGSAVGVVLATHSVRHKPHLMTLRGAHLRCLRRVLPAPPCLPTRKRSTRCGATQESGTGRSFLLWIVGTNDGHFGPVFLCLAVLLITIWLGGVHGLLMMIYFGARGNFMYYKEVALGQLSALW
jgi:hypothetical protein